VQLLDFDIGYGWVAHTWPIKAVVGLRLGGEAMLRRGGPLITHHTQPTVISTFDQA